MISNYKDAEGNVVTAVQYEFSNWEEVATLLGIPPFHSPDIIADGPLIRMERAGKELVIMRGDYVAVDGIGNVSVLNTVAFNNTFSPMIPEPIDTTTTVLGNQEPKEPTE